MIISKTAFYDEETDDFLGNLVQDLTGWQAQTVFGYTIARTDSQSAAEDALREQGLTYLKGVWQYYDKDEYDWFSCILRDANEHRVTVIRTNALGYQTSEDFKMVVIKEPTDQVLVKSS